MCLVQDVAPGKCLISVSYFRCSSFLCTCDALEMNEHHKSTFQSNFFHNMDSNTIHILSNNNNNRHLSASTYMPGTMLGALNTLSLILITSL